MSTSDVAPDGALLSCYTTSIAEVLWHRGVDWAAAIGLGSVLAIRPEGELFAFNHHDTSLRPPGLRRVGTDDVRELHRGLVAAHERDRRVIVVADAHNLPWSTGFGRRHAPHWCVVDGRRDGAWHVTDRFTMLDARGEQSPWHGWMSDDELPQVLCRGDLEAQQVLRERLAFGDEEPPPPGTRYQWFTSTPTASAARVGPPAGDWLVGERAVHRLIEHFTEHGGRARAYRQTEDLWVTGRHRRLRHLVLARAMPADHPSVIAARDLADAWERVPMALRYAAESARRGRPRLAALRRSLSEVAEHEAHMQEVHTTTGKW